jgi:hypothetical protein
MAIDTTQPSSRRALLAAAVGGLGAAAAASLARVAPARADDGDPVILGELNVSTQNTVVQRVSDSGVAFQAVHSGASGRAVVGSSAQGTGLFGNSSQGHALRTQSGRIQIEQVSGVATILAGRTSRDVVPGVPVNARTFVLLTPMANIGSRALWFTKVAPVSVTASPSACPRPGASRRRSPGWRWSAADRPPGGAPGTRRPCREPRPPSSGRKVRAPSSSPVTTPTASDRGGSPPAQRAQPTRSPCGRSQHPDASGPTP